MRHVAMIRAAAAAFAFLILIGNGAAIADPVRWEPLLAGAYDRGVALKKPIIVLYFDGTRGRYDRDVFSTQISLSAKIQRFADSAVWTYANVANEVVARNMNIALDIKQYPTISVLEQVGDVLSESARIAGVVPIGLADDVLAQFITEYTSSYRAKH
jgi:hypothetical protein